MKKVEYYLKALVMTNSASKISSLWYKNINLQGFNNILAKTWKKYVRRLGNSRKISNANIDEVLATVEAQKVDSSV